MFGLPHARHAREYTNSELQELVREAGLEICRIHGRHFYVRSGRRGTLAVAAKRTLDRLRVFSLRWECSRLPGAPATPPGHRKRYDGRREASTAIE